MTADLVRACQKLWPRPQALPSILTQRLLEASWDQPLGQLVSAVSQPWADAWLGAA